MCRLPLDNEEDGYGSATVIGFNMVLALEPEQGSEHAHDERRFPHGSMQHDSALREEIEALKEFNLASVLTLAGTMGADDKRGPSSWDCCLRII